MMLRLPVALALAAALGSAVAFLPAGAIAQQADGDRPAMDDQGPMRHRLTDEDKQAFLDARLAAVHAGLKLSPDQEKLWPAIEGTIRDTIAQMRDARQKMREADEAADKDDPIARMRRIAERSMMRAQRLTRLADAAQPLYATLTDDQKWRLHALLRAVRLHHHHMAMMQRGDDGERRDGDR
ncbi:MAG: Spy/CpxP family protein refolding chaperone [Roseiarcus sp.]